jgi:hypothetical protein
MDFFRQETNGVVVLGGINSQKELSRTSECFSSSGWKEGKYNF